MLMPKFHSKAVLYLLFVLSVHVCSAQVLWFGELSDDDGKPISNANIFIKDRNVGAISDEEGRFVIKIPNNEEILHDSLVFTHLNYKRRIMACTDFQNQSRVMMEKESIELDEFAVYAQYSQYSYDQAIGYSRVSNKPILLFFTASWCGPCNSYKRLFSEENEVSEYLKSHYVLILCDILSESGMKLKRIYHSGSGVPNFIVVSPDERIIVKHQGGWASDDACLDFLKTHASLPDELQHLPVVSTSKYDFSDQEMRKRHLPDFDANMKKTDWRILLSLGLINFTNLESDNGSHYNSYKVGYDFGALIYYHKPQSSFSFQTGFIFSSQGGRHYDTSKSFRVNYLETPLRINYQIAASPFPVKVCMAPYFALGLSAKNKFTNYRLRFGDEANQLKPFDYGFTPGLNFSPVGNMELFTGYKVGLNNISNRPNEMLYNRGFYFLLSVKFFGKTL